MIFAASYLAFYLVKPARMRFSANASIPKTST